MKSALIITVIIFCSCGTIEKNKTTKEGVKKESVKSDSGIVSKKEATKKDEGTYTKETYVYPPQQPGVTNVYPTTVIKETGTNKSESVQSNYDSGWKNKFTELEQKIVEQSKIKVEKPFGLFEIIGIAAVVGLSLFLIIKLFSKFTIIKKVI